MFHERNGNKLLNLLHFSPACSMMRHRSPGFFLIVGRERARYRDEQARHDYGRAGSSPIIEKLRMRIMTTRLGWVLAAMLALVVASLNASDDRTGKTAAPGAPRPAGAGGSRI